MTHHTKRSRRRKRHDRNAQTGAGSRPPLPQLTNPFPPVEILPEEALVRIEDTAFRMLEEGGLEVRSARALAIYKANGADVDEATQMVRMDRDMVRHFVGLAPPSFKLHARNPERAVEVGGANIAFAPVGGPPNASDLDRGRRSGDLATFRDLVRLVHALGVTHFSGGGLVAPIDLPVDSRHLDMAHAHITLGDRAWFALGIGRQRVEDALDMVALARGIDREALLSQPSLYTVINVNSPRRVDEDLLEGLMALAESGQPNVVTPFTLAGAMSPVTIAGALAQQTGEALGVIALTQMIRPGCPVVFGGFTSNVDMKSGAPAFGTPEYVKATLAGGQIARRFALPYRSSSVNTSNAVDAQAVYETSMSLWAAIMSHTNMIMHSIGWLEGGLVASFEKMVVDAEMLRSWADTLKPIKVGTDDLALDAILGVAPGGHFFGEPHTLERYEKAFYDPILSDWRNFETWEEDGARSATERAHTMWQELLDGYEKPPIDPAVEAELDAFVTRRKGEIERDGV